MKIDIIAGARPNFIKIAPVISQVIKYSKIGYNISYRLIHTGQHYDKKMSKIFFEELKIPKPDFNLEVGSGSHANQTSKIMIRYERLLNHIKPDICMVFGDVNSTLACSIVAKKFNIKIAHVEAGIRSFDLSMPEEINRIVTDSITDYFFTTSEFANKNLIKSGIEKENIFFVGNTMIDTLNNNIKKFKKPLIFDKIKLSKKQYLILTLHRPSNVDEIKTLFNLLELIDKNSENLPIIFPIHPRTKSTFNKNNFLFKNIVTIDPLSYLEFNYLVKNSKCVITDSGGITEETTVMNIPCITLRDTTERPETVLYGTNVLVGNNYKKLINSLKNLFLNNWKKGIIPELWDGKSSERIIKNLLNKINKN